MKAELISASELARRLGISRQALAAGVKRGRVAYQDATRRLFNAPEAIATWRATEERLHASRAPMSAADELLEARIRRERAEAALAELKLKQTAGTLVLAADVNERGLRWGLHVRHALEALPPRVAATARAAKTDGEAEALIAREIRQVCTSIAAWRPADAATLNPPEKTHEEI